MEPETEVSEDCVVFVSSDGERFQLTRSQCVMCKNIEAMLAKVEPCKDEPIELPLVTMKEVNLIKAWMSERTLPDNAEVLFRLLKAADFLIFEELTESIYNKFSDLCSGKKLSEIKAIFCLNDSASKSHINKAPGFGGNFELLLYNGKDISLQTKRERCQNYMGDTLTCGDSSTLRLCTGCRMVKFCSLGCQKEYWSIHKKHCKAVQHMRAQVEREREKAVAQVGIGALEGENVGHIWDNPYLRDYCSARRYLANTCLDMANEEEYENMYEEALSHYLELLRLIHMDALGVRETVPFVLINLNRDDDAYNFIKWWITIDPNFDYDWDDVPQNTHEGDWLWLRNESKYESPELMLKSGSENVSLAHIVALLLLKLRIVAKYEADLKICNVIENFLAQIEDLEVSHLLPKVKEKLFTEREDILQEQLNDANYIMQLLENKNEVFLRAVLNPEPLKSQGHPLFKEPGTPEEAFLVLNETCRMFYRIPGAIQKITRVVGSDQSYDPYYDTY